MSGRVSKMAARAPGSPLQSGMRTSTVVRRRAATDGLDRLADGGRSSVGEVVAGHRGDHRVGQSHVGDGLRHPLGLGRVGPARRAGRVDQAEAAGPGALVAVDHEGGGAVGPALEDVGAARLLAHRHQVEAAHGALDVAEADAEVGLDPQPLRLALVDREPAGGTLAVDRRELRTAAVPCFGRPFDDALDDLGHGDVDALRGQGGHLATVDAAGDDAVEPRQVGVDVEGEAVHGAAPAAADADGAQLPRPLDLASTHTPG